MFIHNSCVIFSFADPIHLLNVAVKSVLSDGRFALASPQAAASIKIASALNELWGDQPHKHQSSKIFALYLVTQLKTCFQSKVKSLHLRRERMWGMYHQLRTSDTFRCKWNKFLESSVCVSSSPCFCQYVTNEVFKELIKLEFPLLSVAEDITSCQPKGSPLTQIEKNALRYVAGYVCRKVRDNLKEPSCKVSDKESMIQCLEEISGGTDEERDAEEWTRMIDRGGLWQINDDVFSLFVIMEEEIRQKLTKDSASKLREGTKTEILVGLMQNEELLVQWCFVVGTPVNDSSSVLLQKIAELYLTVRGFAFATSCLELYKQAHKKTLQKKKALRKELCN